MQHKIPQFAQKLEFVGVLQLKSLQYKPLTRLISHYQSIDIGISKAQTRDLKLNPIQNGRQLKLTSRVTLTGCHCGKSWRIHFVMVG